MLRCADRAEDLSTPTASFHSVCDAHSVHMSDAESAELIHVVAERCENVEDVCLEEHAEFSDGAAPNVCESKCKLQVEPARDSQSKIDYARILQSRSQIQE